MYFHASLVYGRKELFYGNGSVKPGPLQSVSEVNGTECYMHMYGALSVSDLSTHEGNICYVKKEEVVRNCIARTTMAANRKQGPVYSTHPTCTKVQ